jgi:hypothetical protein
MTDDAMPENYSLADLEAVERIKARVALRDAIDAARPPPPSRLLVQNEVEAMEERAWRAVIDAARDLVEYADGLRAGAAPPMDRVMH